MTILDTIVAHTRRDLQVAKAMFPLARLEQHAAGVDAPPDFAAALRERTGRPRVIAELKRASPSAGEIRRDFGVISLALELENSGAAALSVLTDTRFFRGSATYLRSVAANASVPVLRKDFIVDEYQIVKAKSLGASAVLLIAACLSPEELRRLHSRTTELGLQALVEVHNRQELDAVLDAGTPAVVGINSRDLKTFKTDLDTTAELLSAIPDSCVKVAESGIRTREDIDKLTKLGADAFLVGETLMRAERPGAALKELLQ